MKIYLVIEHVYVQNDWENGGDDHDSIINAFDAYDKAEKFINELNPNLESLGLSECVETNDSPLAELGVWDENGYETGRSIALRYFEEQKLSGYWPCSLTLLIRELDLN